MARKEIAAAEAIKAFGKQSITVQAARQVTVKGADDVERPGFKTTDEPLAVKHIIAAADYSDRVTIVTLDGRRYEART